MLPCSSRASATSRIARKAEKAQGSRFSRKFAQRQAIEQDDEATSDRRGNEDNAITGGEDSDEPDEWGGEAGADEYHTEEDAARSQPYESYFEPQPESEAQRPRPSNQSLFSPEEAAYYGDFKRQSAYPEAHSTAFASFLPIIPRPNAEDQDRLDEPASSVAARSRNFHTRVTISDDRSEDSDIKARFLLALRSRNENSLQNPLRSSFEAITQPGTTDPVIDAQQIPPPWPNSPTIQVGINDPGIPPSTLRRSNLRRNNPFSYEVKEAEPRLNHRSPEVPSYPYYTGLARRSQVLENYQIEQMQQSTMGDMTARQDHPQFPSSENANKSGEDLVKLLAHIKALQKTADAMKITRREIEPPEYKILHRLSQVDSSNVYLDAPQWVNGQNNTKVLKSSLPLWDVKAYLEQHPSVAFVVYRQYDKKLMSAQPEKDGAVHGGDTGVAPPVRHSGETISIISKDLILALVEFLKTIGGFTEVADSISQYQEVPSPYLFIYHSRKVVQHYLPLIPEQRRKRLSCLLEYVYSTYRDEYQEVDALLQRRKIRVKYIQYLFRLSEVVVERKDKHIRGVCCSSELSGVSVQKSRNKNDNPLAEYSKTVNSLPGKGEQLQKKKNDDCTVHSWNLLAWSWKFDGAFSRVNSTHELTLEVRDKQEHSEVDIDSLNLFPLSFADETTKELLKKRGEMFWKCRFRYLVSYRDDEQSGLDRSADERFMIDLMTYRELHKAPVDEKKGQMPESSTDDLGAAAMKQEDPPEDFVYLIPRFVKGFNLQRKRWVDLEVDRMDDVVWNKKAFKSLVLANKTKDLLEALIRNQLDSEKSTDLIHGKGNGLILLLHGGPGTGKTLTAESVAEIAEKPLYRVTCGDIGTEPDEVEPYLESVLHLGKIWKGVVLLDEADVFLEQRSLDDLRRNALVSIFLRVLEYYDGILVLTSNRVGTFDEAFKSRIQLALHYPKLDHVKRAKVWENFIERLVDLKEENIDFSGLRDNVEELAKNKMNGREIRNAITLARQYTQWKKTKLNFDELQDIIKISGQFDVYLSKLNSDVTQDQLAQDEGLRLAEADK